MKNKMLLGVAALLTLSSLSFGSNYSTESGDVTVNIQIVKPITLTLTNEGMINFGSVPQETNLELSALETVNMNVTGADPTTEIAFYINDEDQDDVAVGEDIELANGEEKLTTTLKLSSAAVTTDESGNASSTISATIAAGAITGTTALGDYSNSVTVYAEYN